MFGLEEMMEKAKAESDRVEEIAYERHQEMMYALYQILDNQTDLYNLLCQFKRDNND